MIFCFKAGDKADQEEDVIVHDWLVNENGSFCRVSVIDKQIHFLDIAVKPRTFQNSELHHPKNILQFMDMPPLKFVFEIPDLMMTTGKEKDAKKLFSNVTNGAFFNTVN